MDTIFNWLATWTVVWVILIVLALMGVDSISPHFVGGLAGCNVIAWLVYILFLLWGYES